MSVKKRLINRISHDFPLLGGPLRITIPTAGIRSGIRNFIGGYSVE
jgi:hypothetical protein